MYINQILEFIVKLWIGDDFILEEDGDSGYGFESKKNIAYKWKQANRLNYYCNCAGSPDFAIIENSWQVSK